MKKAMRILFAFTLTITLVVQLHSKVWANVPPPRWNPFMCKLSGYPPWPACKIPNENGDCDVVVWCSEGWPAD